MEKSVQILEEYLKIPTYGLRDLLVMLYHIYNINSNHPFIPVMQSLCVKQLQEGLNEEDVKAVRDVIETFFLFPKKPVVRLP